MTLTGVFGEVDIPALEEKVVENSTFGNRNSTRGTNELTNQDMLRIKRFCRAAQNELSSSARS